MRAAWLLAGALVLGACGGSGGSGRPTASPTGAGDTHVAPAPPVTPAPGEGSSSGPGPSRSEAGVPVGFQRNRDGAAAAATTYLSTLHQLLASGEADRRAALKVLTAGGADAVISEATTAFATLDHVVAQARATTPNARLFLREVPMAYTVSRLTEDRAQVEVWSLGVIIIEGVTQATEVWSTNTVELVWESGDWKVWSWDRQPGPQPSLATSTPVPAAQVLDAIQGWEGYRYVPAS